MKALLCLVMIGALVACERKPTEEELEQQRQLEAARNSPTPKPGDWMWKDYKRPLDPPKH